MVALADVVRRITIAAKTDGVDQATASLHKLAGAQGDVAVASERVGTANLSMQNRINSLSRTLDVAYRQEQQLARAQKDIAAARNQGLIGIVRENELMALAATRYGQVAEKSEFAAESMKTLKEMSVGLAAGFGAGLVLAGLGEIPGKILETNRQLADLKDTADTIGITAKSLQELQFAGSLANVVPENLNSALEVFSKNLGIAQQHTGSLYAILKANHVTVSGDVTKDFTRYADLVQNASDAEQRNVLVTAAFGKSAQEMGNLFEGGAEGIRNAAKEAERFGAVLGGGAIDAAKRMDDELVTLKARSDGLFKEFALSTAPILLTTMQEVNHSIAMASYGIAQLKLGNIGEGLQGLFDMTPVQGTQDGERIDPFGYSRYADRQFKAGALADSHANMTTAAASAFYSSFDQIQKPLKLTVGGGGHTVLPTTPDPAVAQQAKQIKSVTDALNLQIKNLTESSRQQAINNELAKAHVTAASKDGIAIAALAGQYYDQAKAIKDANDAASFFAQTTESAFTGVVDGSLSVTDALGQMVKALASAVFQAELLGSGTLAGILGTAPTTAGAPAGILGSLFSGLLHHNAAGGVYSGAGISAYSGQVVSSPTLFPFAKGTGLMGEAGPEAIMPLKRGADGRLGVSAANDNRRAANDNGSTIVHYHIDAKGAEIGVEDKIVNALKSYDANLPARVQKIARDPRAR